MDLKLRYIDEVLAGEGHDIKDKYHSMSELYFHRMILFAVICNKDHRAWKSKLHNDGTMFDNYFIVGIDTTEGQYSYHYHIKFWYFFECRELEKAPKYDGHEPADIGRLLSL